MIRECMGPNEVRKKEGLEQNQRLKGNNGVPMGIFQPIGVCDIAFALSVQNNKTLLSKFAGLLLCAQIEASESARKHQEGMGPKRGRV